MTKQRIPQPADLATVDRLLADTAEERERIAREDAERGIDDLADVGTAEHVRRTGLTPPEQS